MNQTKFNPEQLRQKYSEKSPVSIIKLALGSFDNIAISFSGAEDVILIDMATKIKPDISVFSLDTGRLPAETYRFIEQVREHYGIEINILFPDAAPVEALVRKRGFIVSIVTVTKNAVVYEKLCRCKKNYPLFLPG